MGVLNVTPDSFSDGGVYFDPDAAIARGMEMISQGVDVIDVGGESTRPGARPVPESEERRRVVDVIRELSPLVRVSVDTVKRAVAEAALDVGASLLNDVLGDLGGLAAEAKVPWVVMHSRGTPLTMQSLTGYGDVVEEVRSFLKRRAEQALAAGVPEVWTDPGIGFAKTAEQNLSLLRRLGEIVTDGYPVLVGTSRKGFLGKVTASPLGSVPGPMDRLEASLATATAAMVAGAAMVRVHDVPDTIAAALLVGDAGG